MRVSVASTLLTVIAVGGCASFGPFKKEPASVAELYVAETTQAEYVSASPVPAPLACFEPDDHAGAPVSYHQGSIIDKPRLVRRKAQKVPSRPVAGRNFYCAAFDYSVDHRGRVTDIHTIYNSHPGLGGIDFARMAKRTLQNWEFEPGMVDKAPQQFTGLRTVFYYGFE